ncbi:hypothetical protein CLOM_g5645 [Closterium sp. NIES-68]|nr:hypothetical protein CLOM_g5645 [Closterium sp. NIES-68]GJP63998.1 hypothetical protein CLOP_g21035 [Closterium sp. NIES-67]
MILSSANESASSAPVDPPIHTLPVPAGSATNSGAAVRLPPIANAASSADGRKRRPLQLRLAVSGADGEAGSPLRGGVYRTSTTTTAAASTAATTTPREGLFGFRAGARRLYEARKQQVKPIKQQQTPVTLPRGSSLPAAAGAAAAPEGGRKQRQMKRQQKRRSGPGDLSGGVPSMGRDVWEAAEKNQLGSGEQRRKNGDGF